jgi:hypothetical protein
MKLKRTDFIQNLMHDIYDLDEAESYIEIALPLIGRIVMEFNALEQSFDQFICHIFSDRSEDLGLTVINKMTYSNKVDLFKRLSDDLHYESNLMNEKSNQLYDDLIKNLKESGRLRNLVVHADWESTNKDKYTYVNLRITKEGKKQEYVQFSEKSLEEIIDLIWKTRKQISDYWEIRDNVIYN